MKALLTYGVNDYPNCGGGNYFEELDTGEVEERANDLLKEYGERLSDVTFYLYTSKVIAKKAEVVTKLKFG